jgi:hypothetical protein
MSQGKLNGANPGLGEANVSGAISQQGMVPNYNQPTIGQFNNSFGQPNPIQPAQPQNGSLNPVQGQSTLSSGAVAPTSPVAQSDQMPGNIAPVVPELPGYTPPVNHTMFG